MASDARVRQMAGWVSRTFDGATITTTLPKQRGTGVEVSVGENMTDQGRGLLTSMLAATRHDWCWLGSDDTEVPVTYRVLVGKASIVPWVDLLHSTMRGRFGYWPAVDRIVVVVDHPDSVLMSGEGKRARITTNVDALKTLKRIVDGDIGALDVMGGDCVLCAQDGKVERNVVEMDRNGLGLCKRHSGFDIRPEVQKWQQESMFDTSDKGQ